MLSELFNLEKIMGVCEKICYFLMVNLLFLVFNIPVLLFFLFLGIGQIRTYLPLFLCSIIPLAPALSAVFYTMSHLIRGTENRVVRDYWKGYKTDLGRKIKLGAIQVFAILVTWTNVEFFSKQVLIVPLTILFALIFAFVILMTPNLYLLACRYEMDVLAIFKTAAVLTVARPINTLGTVAALGIILMGLELSAGTTVLFMASAYGFLVVFMSQKVMQELEKRS